MGASQQTLSLIEFVIVHPIAREEELEDIVSSSTRVFPVLEYESLNLVLELFNFSLSLRIEIKLDVFSNFVELAVSCFYGRGLAEICDCDFRGIVPTVWVDCNFLIDFPACSDNDIATRVCLGIFAGLEDCLHD